MNLIKSCQFSLMMVSLIVPAVSWANSCDQASELVVQAYSKPDTVQKRLLEEALQLCPTHGRAHNNLGVLLEKQKRYDAALTHYQQATQSTDDVAKTYSWLGIGDIYYQQKQWPLSLEAYLQICSKHKRAKDRVGELLRDNRYRTVDANQLLNHQSLLLLYDSERLQNLYKLANQCQQQSLTKGSKESPLPINSVPLPDKCRQQFENDTRQVVHKAILEPVVIYRNIQFKLKSYELTSASYSQLEQLATSLSAQEEKVIYISGHSDSQGWRGIPKAESDQMNQELSENRARTVKEALVERYGIAEGRIKTRGCSYSSPLVAGNSEVAWAKNRRVEIELGD